MSGLKNKSAAEAFRRLVERNFKDSDMELNISYEEEPSEAASLLNVNRRLRHSEAVSASTGIKP